MIIYYSFFFFYSLKNRIIHYFRPSLFTIHFFTHYSLFIIKRPLFTNHYTPSKGNKTRTQQYMSKTLSSLDKSFSRILGPTRQRAYGKAADPDWVDHQACTFVFKYTCNCSNGNHLVPSTFNLLGKTYEKIANMKNLQLFLAKNTGSMQKLDSWRC